MFLFPPIDAGERGSTDGEELIGGGGDGRDAAETSEWWRHYRGCFGDFSGIMWLIGSGRCLRFDGR